MSNGSRVAAAAGMLGSGLAAAVGQNCKARLCISEYSMTCWVPDCYKLIHILSRHGILLLVLMQILVETVMLLESTS
jgi:hypothetical protein